MAPLLYAVNSRIFSLDVGDRAINCTLGVILSHSGSEIGGAT